MGLLLGKPDFDGWSLQMNWLFMLIGSCGVILNTHMANFAEKSCLELDIYMLFQGSVAYCSPEM